MKPGILAQTIAPDTRLTDLHHANITALQAQFQGTFCPKSSQPTHFISKGPEQEHPQPPQKHQVHLPSVYIPDAKPGAYRETPYRGGEDVGSGIRDSAVATAYSSGQIVQLYFDTGTYTLLVNS